MSIQSAPFYWLACDVPGCREESAGLIHASRGDFTAFADIPGWLILPDNPGPLQHICPAHALNRCKNCGAELNDYGECDAC